VRFDVVIRLAAALEKSAREWLEIAGHPGVSDVMIDQVSKRAGILDFYGEDDPTNFFKILDERIKKSPPVIVSMTYCTFSDFAHQEFLAQQIAPLINKKRLFLAIVCAYPEILDLGKQKKQTLSSIYLQVRSETIGLTKRIKAIVDTNCKKHVACFSLKPLDEPTCFPQVGLSQFRQILIQSYPDYENKPDDDVFELSTWLAFFQDQRERWVRIYPTPDIWKAREDSYRKICSAWKDYLQEIHGACDRINGWRFSQNDGNSTPWEMIDIN